MLRFNAGPSCDFLPVFFSLHVAAAIASFYQRALLSLALSGGH